MGEIRKYGRISHPTVTELKSYPLTQYFLFQITIMSHLTTRLHSCDVHIFYNHKITIATCLSFPCEMEFSHHESPNPTRVAKWDSETSGEKSISNGKPYKMHFLAYFTLQSMVIMLNTRHKVCEKLQNYFN